MASSFATLIDALARGPVEVVRARLAGGSMPDAMGCLYKPGPVEPIRKVICANGGRAPELGPSCGAGIDAGVDRAEDSGSLIDTTPWPPIPVILINTLGFGVSRDGRMLGV